MLLAAGWSWRDRLVVRAVLCTGFHFLLRCGEYMSRGGEGWDARKILRGCDVVFRCQGKVLKGPEIAAADQVSLFLRESKADQFNQGAVLTHFAAAPDLADLCPVRALRDLHLTFPERWEAEALEPLFRWEDSSPVARPMVRDLLGEAGEQEGVPRGEVGTHSLRAGGASAVFAASGGNAPLTQRVGRWASSAYEGYIWETEALTRGLSSEMIRAPQAYHYTKN